MTRREGKKSEERDRKPPRREGQDAGDSFFKYGEIVLSCNWRKV